MKLNKFQVSTVLYFKSGNSKKVDWVEERLVKKIDKETEEVTQPLTLEEADLFFQSRFKEWIDKGETIVRKNAKKETSVIPFSSVEYATVSVTLLGEDNLIVEGERELNNNEDSSLTPPQPNEKWTRIEDHPAYKK
ncbi:hypothetical protein MOC55_13700 [Bacillus spizizenii]|uniref:Uncharacterized protein n=1 Tax=Bacillus spizizenii TaxID=96241 RepID=A0A9Q4DSC3_BACSC|nr:hypothetical protein [Bacillus spizizenii]MCY8155518.1 hypothetical protein [Bacillus spizizenii]MCY8312916.1 hypothetical protein [Bacillus spizizenii]MCY8416669.1 hypothetical protein [Bacillus spizizenii]MCY9333743.1 hypothetical protein [Bacillus spizizenii]